VNQDEEVCFIGRELCFTPFASWYKMIFFQPISYMHLTVPALCDAREKYGKN
jgi:hypothetical protein